MTKKIGLDSPIQGAGDERPGPEERDQTRPAQPKQASMGAPTPTPLCSRSRSVACAFAASLSVCCIM
jgi:hypothetical protein